MASSAVARNYAATLFHLAAREEREEEYGILIDTVGDAYEKSERFQRFLDAPGVEVSTKREAIKESLSGMAPDPFLRFLFVVLDRRRHRILPSIAQAYGDLLDDRAGRIRATVTLPFEADEELRASVRTALEKRYGKTVAASFEEDQRILGGVVVRVGDELFDASVRRRLDNMRRKLRLN